MKNIAITVNNTSVGTEIFDIWAAFRQSKNSLSNYNLDVDIQFVSAPVDTPNTINILYDYMPSFLSESKISKFDLIFLDNGSEPFGVSTELIYNLVNTNTKCYMIASEYTDVTHPLHNKIIPFNHDITIFRDCITRGYYPQYYELSRHRELVRTYNLCYINGDNRAWRNYFFKLLTNANLPNIKIKNNVKSKPSKILDNRFETLDDRVFRNLANADIVYDTQHYNEMKYYDTSPTIGIAGKFGKIPPGYFLLDEYFKHQCVIYPESEWINNQACITEKTWKCFAAYCIPFPISGSNINTLYNQLGFKTAWNLLPDKHKQFDFENNHELRYKQTIDAITWLYNNPDVFNSIEAKQIRESNFAQLFSNYMDSITAHTLDCILNAI